MSNPDYTVTENGIAGVGEATAQNERTARSIAVRMARARLMSGINSALASVDKYIGLETAIHTENTLQETKIVNVDISTRADSYTATAIVELNHSTIKNWAEAYYDNLLESDPIRAITKEEFVNLIYSSFNNKN